MDIGKDLNRVEKEAYRNNIVYLIFSPGGQIREERFLTPSISRNPGHGVLVPDTSAINL